MKVAIALLLVLAVGACGDLGEMGPRKVGQSARHDGVTTTLRDVDYPFTGDEAKKPDKGKVFIGLKVKTCVDESASGGRTSTNSAWTLVAADGSRHAGTKATAWRTWPSPKYPEDVALAPGKCANGWMVVQVPEGHRFTRVIHQEGKQTAADWTGDFRRD